MATYIFGGLTTAVLVLSIWMGVKNNDEFEKQVNRNKDAQRELKEGQADLAVLTTKLEETFASTEAKLTEDAEESAKLKGIQKELVALEDDIKTKKSTVAENATKIAANDTLRADLPDPAVLVPEIKATKIKIAQLKSDIESDASKLADLTQRAEGIIAEVARKRSLVESLNLGRSLPSLTTSVNSVFHNWGFVTLNAGNAAGVVPGSALDVLRNGEVVAKLKVTAVEQNRAVADILITDDQPYTVALRSGDRVVAEKIAQQ